VLVVRVGFLAAALSIGTILASVAAAPAYAQDDVRKRGDIACKSSSNKLCSKHFSQGDMAILACLQQNKVRLASSCRKFLTEIGQLQ
jgi:hypothetical protein